MNTFRTLLVLSFAMLLSTSCERLYDIEGQVVNSCNQPVPGVTVIFAGCSNAIAIVGSNPYFDYTTITDANGRFSFRERERCDDVYLNIDGKASVFLTDRHEEITYVLGEYVNVFFHFNLKTGDKISEIYVMDLPVEQRSYSSQYSDSLFRVDYMPLGTTFRIKTKYYSTTFLMERIDTIPYNCDWREKHVYVQL